MEGTTANPTALGLFGFGMTTLLLNIHNIGLFPLDGTILAMGICFGGLAQIVAGLMDFKRNAMFGATAFTAYGFFWLSLVLIKTDFIGVAVDNASLGTYFAIWGLMTLILFLGTLKGNRSLMLVFLTLTMLFFVLAAGTIAESDMIMKIAGIVGIVCGCLAIYTAGGEILKEQYGRNVIPL